MAIKVLINGAFGKMGQITTDFFSTKKNIEVVGQLGRQYDLKKAIIDSDPDVVIDFTHPSCVYENTLTIIEQRKRPVIGTSGLTLQQVDELKKRCDAIQLGGLIAPNFSLGAVLMLKCAKEIAKYFPNVEIIEMHHDQKADAPSGTAVRTAEMLANALANVKKPDKTSHEIIKGARGGNHGGIHIHSVRLPGYMAHQQIIFGDQGETLTLKHDSIDRICFMEGLQLACEKVMTINHMVYGLEELL